MGYQGNRRYILSPTKIILIILAVLLVLTIGYFSISALLSHPQPTKQGEKAMTESEESSFVNVVFEYTKGSSRGGRFYSSYPNQAAVKKVRIECEEPNSNTKIHAVGVSDAEAQRMCMEAMVFSGVFERKMDAIDSDSDMPEEVKRLEKMKFELAGATSLAGLLGMKP